MTQAAPPVLLVVDDDEIDRRLALDAAEQGGFADSLKQVSSGRELLAYLRREGAFESPASSPRPAVILLDVSMPRMSGFEVLAEIKADPTLRRIPVAMFSSSKLPRDVDEAYECGAASYIVKPSDFDELVGQLRTIHDYWGLISARPGIR